MQVDEQKILAKFQTIYRLADDDAKRQKDVIRAYFYWGVKSGIRSCVYLLLGEKEGDSIIKQWDPELKERIVGLGNEQK